MGVTVGEKASNKSAELFKSDNYHDYLLWHGFSTEVAEAFAEYIHRHIRIELGIAKDESENYDDIIKGKYQGKRYSPGYQACPDLSDQKKFFQILNLEDIGMKLSENFQLIPEQSVTAFVIYHPEAKYFSAN